MSKNIIEVRNLGKKYIINHQQNERYTALRDVMVNKIKNFGKNKIDTGAQEEFWALKNISFDIKPGDKVGIIGRNGAGKSTLLKLLSRITEPTTGSIKINGRVASLLEVGTGFHPELTGRENIFLNGAILGMSKQEIKKKFDEIVEFAEVSKFLDTPVKRYSSGMYVRLAFSVAAHMEPEILIVDEVLAVGDAQFQRKCLGKMGDVSKEGRTVLFVSHNMGAIQQLCDKGILLDKGLVISHGDIKSQVDMYSYSDTNFYSKLPYQIGKNLRIMEFNLRVKQSEMSQNILFNISIEATHKDIITSLVIIFSDTLGTRLAIIDLRSKDCVYKITKNLQIEGTIRSVPFIEGIYNVGIYIESEFVTADILDICQMEICEEADNNKVIPYSKEVRGYINLDTIYKINCD